MSINLEYAKIKVNEAYSRNRKELFLFNFNLQNDDLKYLFEYIHDKIPDLKELSINYCSNITRIPEQISLLNELSSLVISNFENLTDLPDEIGRLSNLVNLEIVDTEKLKVIPETIGELVNLESLELTNTIVEVLPESLGNLTKLQKLQLHNNKLKELPDTIGDLHNLVNLKLESNEIEALPNNIGDLRELRTLDLQNNQLESIPDSICNLENLRLLNLSYNSIQTLSSEITSLPELTILNSLDDELSQGFNITEDSESLYSFSYRSQIDNPIDMDGFSVTTPDENSLVFNAATSLELLYPEEQDHTRIKVALESLYTNNKDNSYKDEEGNLLSTKQVIDEFLGKIPSRGTGELQEIYNTATKSLLDKVLGSDPDVRELTLQAMATSLGNCATPVKSFLIQYYLGNNQQNRDINSPIMNTLIEREALEEKIRTIINQQSTDGEFIEKVNGYSNFIYDENTINNQEYVVPIIQEGGRNKYLGSKSAYPEYANRRATENEDEIKIFARICCKTDDQNNLIEREDGKYIVDTIKLKDISESYCRSRGIATLIGRCLDDFDAEFQKYFRDKKNIHAQELISDHYLNPEVMEAIDANAFRNTLKGELLSMDPSDYKEHTEIFFNSCKARIEGIEIPQDQEENSVSRRSSTTSTTTSTRPRSRRSSRGM
ncbi:leucine-rich repeat domain-containing protein [Aquimarina sp. W85]|uniref:leucine-rich repeat domain-containing protein n=1 Tax=Aquimarina rhodophyticola TaxID=3342246 RepID=UPI003672D4D8